jgi:hypothetical protein
MILFRSKYIIIRAAIINFWLREQFAVVTQRFKVIDIFAIGISSSLVFEIFILILFRCTSNILLIFLPMCERWTSSFFLQEIEAEGTEDVSERPVGETDLSEAPVVSCVSSSDVSDVTLTEIGQRPTTPRTQNVNKVKPTPKETTIASADKEKIEEFGLHRSVK